MFQARTLQFIFHVPLNLSWNLISGFGFIIELYEASPVSQVVKNLPAMQGTWVQSRFGKISWRRECLPIPIFLPGEFHGQKSLVSYSPWDYEESDTTE